MLLIKVKKITFSISVYLFLYALNYTCFSLYQGVEREVITINQAFIFGAMFIFLIIHYLVYNVIKKINKVYDK